ncbi:MAG: hypothetical protein M3Z23_11185 [Acidobacteriota bacterium]|nr:hypothetical protein [Acidobacteriota bacterium]
MIAIFKFVGSPFYEQLQSGIGLCDQLRAAGQKVVPVGFDFWGNRYIGDGFRGYNMETVDGNKIQNAGGPAWAHGDPGFAALWRDDENF